MKTGPPHLATSQSPIWRKKIRLLLSVITFGIVLASCTSGASPAPTVPRDKLQAPVPIELGSKTTSSFFAGSVPVQPINLIAFISQSTLYASSLTGNNSLFYVSGNGGINWEEQSTVPGQIVALDFINATDGYALSEPGSGGAIGALYATMDGGRSWKLASNGEFFAINFTSPTDGIALVSSNPLGTARVVSTTDGGLTWRPLSGQTFPSVNGGILSFTSPQVGWMATASEPGAGSETKSLYETTNGGITWTIRSSTAIPSSSTSGSPPNTGLPMGGYLSSLKFTSATTGYMGLDRGAVLRTTDSGLKWSCYALCDQQDHFVSSLGVSAGKLTSLLDNGTLLDRVGRSTVWKMVFPARQFQQLVATKTGIAALSSNGHVYLYGKHFSQTASLKTPNGTVGILEDKGSLLAYTADALDLLSVNKAPATLTKLKLDNFSTLSVGQNGSVLGVEYLNSDPMKRWVVESENLGRTWTRIPTGPIRPIMVGDSTAYGLVLFGNTIGSPPTTFAAKPGFYITTTFLYQSKDAGRHWIRIKTGPVQSAGGLSLASNGEVAIWWDQTLLLRANPTGSLRSFQLPSYLATPSSISVLPNGTILLTSDGTVYDSQDGGLDWGTLFLS